MLYDHQKQMLDFTLAHNRSCLLAEVGTGKTRPAILSFYERKMKGEVSKCLVVCPANILVNWKREINALGLPLTAVVVYGTKQQRQEFLKQDADMYIINFDYLKPLLSELLLLKADMVIVDELTYVKHYTAQRSKSLRLITNQAKCTIGLTGTMITNTPMDAFGEMLVIEPRLFGTNFYAFRNKYFVNIGRYFPQYKLKSGALDSISERLSKLSILFKKADCLDLPDVVYETIQIPMPLAMKRDYTSMQKQLVLEFDNGVIASAQIALVKLLRLAQITSGFIKTDESEIVTLPYNPKVEVLANLLENELSDKKVIVWCRFKHTIHTLERRFAEYNPAILYGDITDKQTPVDKFQEDETCKLFIGQVATGFGYNLTKSDTMIYLENDFSVEHRFQSLGRNNRIGQTSDKLTVIDLVIENSIDEYVLSCLENNKNIADIIYEILSNNNSKGV